MPQNNDDGGMGEWVDDLRRKAQRVGERAEQAEGQLRDLESQEYRQFKEEEIKSREKNWYERFVGRTAFFNTDFDDMEESHKQAIRLLEWSIDYDEIVPGALVMALLILPISLLMVLQPFISFPTIFNLFFLSFPMIAFVYMLKYPSLKAQEKLVRSSEGLILGVLYMVVYMRQTANLEGAVGFAARHLDGPVSKDLKRLMWRLDVREVENIQEALDQYLDRWAPFNKGFVEAMSIVKSAVSASNESERSNILDEAVDTLLNNTQEQMDQFARGLKMPIMVIHGIGILLPVLGIILFPLVANFMKGANMGLYLAFLYNIILPFFVFAILRILLTQRPMTFSSASGKTGEVRASVNLNIMGKELDLSMFWFSIPLFLLMMIWPGLHYYDIVFGGGSFPPSPGIVTIIQEMFIILAFTIPAGIHMIYGYSDDLELQKKVEGVEAEFAEALFELGKALKKGQPIERAIDDAAHGARELDISDMFDRISYNIKSRGMTFKQAVFDPQMGVIHQYPSQLMSTILEIVAESTRKGSRTAATSIINISEYLQRIHETQEKLEELMGDTLSSVKFLGYILAPVISGVAVGMGATISSAFYKIQQVFEGSANASAGAGSGAGGISSGSVGLLEMFASGGNALPPGLLQLIVGIYLVQISYLIAVLFVRLKEGDNPVKLKVTLGRLFITSSIAYTFVVVIIVGIFGGIIAGVGGTG